MLIEAEDQCGGIASETLSSMFKAYSQSPLERSGLGLGLTIVQRAVRLSGGTVEVRNNPGHGCTFSIEIPQKLIPGPSTKQAVRGVDSIRPIFPKRK